MSRDTESQVEIDQISPIDPVNAPITPLPKPAEIAFLEASPPAGTRKHPRRWAAALVAGALTIGLVSTIVVLRRRSEWNGELKPKQLTTNPDENFVQNAIISPDGKSLLYGDKVGIHIRLISTGETHTFNKPAALSSADVWIPTAWFPDQSRFVAVSKSDQSTTSWTVPALGGDATVLRADAFAYSVSPDGTLIGFTAGLETAEEIWVMGSHGEDARRIAAKDGSASFRDLQWSPDGQLLSDVKFQLGGNVNGQFIIESRDLRGGVPTVIVSIPVELPGWKNGKGFCWLPNGRIIYTSAEPSPESSDTNLWQIGVEPKTGRPLGQPRRLTNWFGFHINGLSHSRDGKKMALQKSSTQSYVDVGEFDSSGRLKAPRRLTLEESIDLPLAWTPDSQAVIFTSDRNGSLCLYKQRLDKGVAEPSTTGPDINAMADVSPDGRWKPEAVKPPK